MLKETIRQYILNNRQNGKRGCFMWDEEGLESYLNWSFSRNNLFIVLNKNGISGAGVAYALPNSCDFSITSLFPYDKDVTEEHNKDLCIMDWIADDDQSRRELVNQFKKRFWNWEKQRKFGIHYGKVKELSNNYLNKLNTI